MAPHTAVKQLSTAWANGSPTRSVHASWLNQVEIYFSIIQRKIVTPNDFTDLTKIEERLTYFEARYNATAGPFKWKFTTTDLTGLLNRLDQHHPTHNGPAQAA